MSLPHDPQWYKDAIIYQLHVKAFFDANDDGTGDFAGLLQKLPYIQDLGCNTVWLLPFYPSPLRDDGYDIADYRRVHEIYGDMSDFRRFVREAHKRGIRVITELVINHTSDQHKWFQRARRARPGSAARNLYVWSDTDQKYQGTRVIFIDTQTSNWTWDPEAQAYFWHRFYSHQPDLNFDNPRVLQEILSILHFWLGMGVDGLRLDAVPYLCEREGTNNENLPETHAILKRIRAEVDAHYPDRMLLAEANQWPEDTRPYFGDGDESHMAFHFPLMPRMYMAVAQEDRHPITDIIRQTPVIPDSCQWAIFLRNHDELTLEMVTDKERDYLWDTYAKDPRMRLNLGIRRRLAPLMENNRAKIELMNALLMSMPGTPVIYYGDELGMGDNVFLGDRDGVRTPMQWTPDRNGGFSRTDPQRLYLPPIMDPVYGYGALNVEAQQADASSLLNWMKRLLKVRNQHQVFGRGQFRFLYPRNRRILAYLREHDDNVVLCVANLGRSAQSVELDLSEFKGWVPIELLGGASFPPIGELPYLLTLPAYGFFWFSLAQEGRLPEWYEPVPDRLPEFATFVMANRWSDLLGDDARTRLEREVAPAFFANQRWFAAKQAVSPPVRLTHAVPFPDESADRSFLLTEFEVDAPDARHTYLVPLACSWDDNVVAFGSPYLSYTLARVRHGARTGALYDATVDDRFGTALISALRHGLTLDGDGYRLIFNSGALLAGMPQDADTTVERLSTEQSNTSLLYGSGILIKLYRRLQPGLQPEVEVARHLTERTGFDRTPCFLGSIEKRINGIATAYGVAFQAVANQGNGWQLTVNWLQRYLEQLLFDPDGSAAEADDAIDDYLALARMLARRTGEMHLALCAPSEEPAFAPEPASAADMAAWADMARERLAVAESALAMAERQVEQEAGSDIRKLLDAHDRIAALIDEAAGLHPEMVKCRIHGDYHLGQVLVSDRDFYIIDFEGEPSRPVEERRAKGAVQRDVAGMLRSFDYAASSALRWAHGAAVGDMRADAICARWNAQVQDAFLTSYRQVVAEAPCWPGQEAADRLLRLFLLEKALYEISYEAAHRPDWLDIPVAGTLRLIGDKDA